MDCLDLNEFQKKLSTHFRPWQHSFQFWLRATDIYTGYKVFQLRVMVDRRGVEEQFISENIVQCIKKATAVDLKQSVQVDKDLQIRAYCAGHVLGAAMIYAKVGDAAIVYTGDYNMAPNRHLEDAQIDRLWLDLVITESTYATTVRDSKYAREREFPKVVHKCVASEGKGAKTDGLGTCTYVKARHILCEKQGKINEAYKKLQDCWKINGDKVPPAEFAKLAAEYSECPSGKKGGD